MTERNLAVDSLKIALACMVVGIHGHFLKNESPWLSSLLTDGLFRVAVPAFFVLNGYYLAPGIDDAAVFGRWLKRILILYGLWSLIYLPQFAPPWHPFNQFGVLLATGFNHLWYLIAAAMGGCLLYIVHGRWPSILAILAVVLFAAGAFIQYTVNYEWLFRDEIERLHFLTPLYRNFVFFAFPYMTLGFVMARQSWVGKASTGMAWSVVAVGIALVTAEAFVNLSHHVAGTFDLLLTAPVAALGLCLLTLKSTLKTTSGSLSHLSIFIYLLHPWLLIAFAAVGFSATWRDAPLAILVCVIVAPAGIWLNRRLPVKIL